MVEGDGADGRTLAASPAVAAREGGLNRWTRSPSDDEVRAMDGALDLPRRTGRAVRPVGSVFLLVSGEPSRVRTPATRSPASKAIYTAASTDAPPPSRRVGPRRGPGHRRIVIHCDRISA